MMIAPSTRTDWRSFALITLAAIAARCVTWGNPAVGFDEQYYLLVGDRIAHGALAYVDIWDRKPIGLFVIFAAIRRLGGDGVLQAQLVAGACALATALCIRAFALRLAAAPAGATMAAIAYLVWLNFCEGEGAQAAVFYNLPMAAAALLVGGVVAGWSRRPRRDGAAAMALCGIALQIKYTAGAEGVFLGLALALAAWRRGDGAARTVAAALLHILIALLPTLAAAAWFERHGAFDAWFFANFVSIFGKGDSGAAQRLLGWLLALAITAPLWLLALRAPRPACSTGRRFVALWLAAAVIGLVPMVNVPNPNFLPPVLAPLCVLAAPGFARHRRVGAILLLMLFVVGQTVLLLNQRVKGNAAQARALVAAATPARGCLYVYDGYPVLYHLTGSCLPTRYAFPGLLNAAAEDHAETLGVSPEEEVRRILATRPEKIADVRPAWSGGNPRARALVEAALRRDYRLTFAIRTGGNVRQVYTRRDAMAHR